MIGDAQAVARYLVSYIEAYRKEYDRAVSPAPAGAGLPRLAISPYLTTREVRCYVARDGAVVADCSAEPSYEWFIDGGPALMVDTPQTRTPPEVTAKLKSAGVLGKPIGIYRIVAQSFPDEVWRGELTNVTASATACSSAGFVVSVNSHDLTWSDLIERLTFGAFGRILDLHLPRDENSWFWRPTIVRNLGFVTADRQHRRFYHYMEFLRHVTPAAWDKRSIWTRAEADVRRDYMSAVARVDAPGGALSLGEPGNPEELHQKVRDRLTVLEQAIVGFERLLETHSDADEVVFHEFLKTNPVLIDLYGHVTSKPRFEYPEGQSPLGKSFIVPDFLVSYEGYRYTLIEIEKPGKRLATQRGHAAAELSQAAFQIAEFRDYLREHYDLLKSQYPGINQNCRTILIVSRAAQLARPNREEQRRHMQLLQQQFGADQLMTYDDLLANARAALVRLATLPGAPQP